MRSAWPTGAPYADVDAHHKVGDWYRSQSIGSFYYLGGKPTIHTGDDLLIWRGNCAFMPVYAVADGTVIYSAEVPRGTWGNLVVIRHTDTLYSRYGHLDNRRVNRGEVVHAGQQIGTVGNARGQLVYHLHFDMSNTSLLGHDPQNWPGENKEAILRNYIDPLQWIKKNLENGMARDEFFSWLKKQPDNQPIMILSPNLWPPIEATVGDINALRGVETVPDAPIRAVKVTDDGVRVRQAPTMDDANIKAAAAKDTLLNVTGEPQNGFVRIADGDYAGCYISTVYLTPA